MPLSRTKKLLFALLAMALALGAVAGTSPQTIPTSAAQKFYRAKR